MSEFVKSAMAYKLALLVGFFFAIGSIGSSVMTGLSGVDHWNQLTGTQQVCIICGIGVSFANTMGAFVNKALSRVEKGEPPIETGDTNHITKP